MLKLIILAVVGYIFYRALKSWMLGSGPPPADAADRRATEVDDVLVQDPVCQTYIVQRDSVQLRQGGKILYFCSEQCRDRFIASHAGDPS
jgi:YHS domain-containing protein